MSHILFSPFSLEYGFCLLDQLKCAFPATSSYSSLPAKATPFRSRKRSSRPNQNPPCRERATYASNGYAHPLPLRPVEAISALLHEEISQSSSDLRYEFGIYPHVARKPVLSFLEPIIRSILPALSEARLSTAGEYHRFTREQALRRNTSSKYHRWGVEGNISLKAKMRLDEFYEARKISVNRPLRLSGSRKQQRTHYCPLKRIVFP